MDNLIIFLYGVGLLTAVGFSVAFPILFIEDVKFLSNELFKWFDNSIMRVHPFVPIVFPVYVCFHGYITFYMIVLKWFKYVPQLLPAIYYSSHLISKKVEELPNWEDKIKLYRAAFILVRLFNEVFSLILISVNGIIITMGSIAFSIYILTQPSIIFSFSLILESGGMLFWANTTFQIASVIYDSSTGFIQKLRRVYTFEDDEGRRKRTIASLQKCKVYCGTMYFVDRRVVFRINDLVINSTINCVIFFRK